MKRIEWVKNKWKSTSKLRIIEVGFLVLTFFLSLFAFLGTLGNNAANNDLASKQASAQEEIARLLNITNLQGNTTNNIHEAIKQLLDNQTMLQGNITQLLYNQTMAQEKIAQLTENQTNLQQMIFKIQNPTPTITVQSMQPILIGPPPSSQISVSPNGVVSFEYNGTLYLNMTVFVSTEHGGMLAIPRNSWSLTSTYNASEIWIGFSYSGISGEDYLQPITVQTTKLLSINISLRIFYEFTNSHILEYSYYPIGYVSFSLSFIDTWTNSTYSQTAQTPFQWNNSTSMP
jgi:hypothetical protein